MGVLECFWAGETARRRTDTDIFPLGQSRLDERERASEAYIRIRGLHVVRPVLLVSVDRRKYILATRCED